MQIDIKGRNVPVTDELRMHAERRLRKVSRQVSEFAELELELFEERNPAIADRHVAEATLHLKGVTLMPTRAVNPYHVLGHQNVLLSEAAARKFSEALAK